MSPRPVGSNPRGLSCDPPDSWRRPYGDRRQCWGCGLAPDVVVSDRHYGHDQWRPFCGTCWELVEPAMRRLVRPPIGSGGHPQPIVIVSARSLAGRVRRL